MNDSSDLIDSILYLVSGDLHDELFPSLEARVAPAFWVVGASNTHRDYQALVSLALFTTATTKADAKNG
jgi:hypothetical protein